MSTVQNTTGAGGGLLAGPVLVWIWGMIRPDYPMDPIVASAIGSILGTWFGSLLPELWGMLNGRFNPPPPSPPAGS